MSNESGGITRTQVVDIAQKAAEKAFQQANKYTDQEVGRIWGLTQQEFKAVHSRIHKLEDDLMTVKHQLEQLMTEVSKSFQGFQLALNRIHEAANIQNERIREVNSSIQTGNDVIHRDIQESSEQTKVGLTKVSSGAAMIDLLNAISQAHDSKNLIQRSIGEIQERFEQAMMAVNEKQELFNGHFAEVNKGFEGQMRVIAEHINEISDNILKSYSAMEANLGGEMEVGELLPQAQRITITKRSQEILERQRGIDWKAIEQYEELQEQMKVFLSNESALRLEQWKAEDLAGTPPAFAFRVNTVVLRESPWVKGPLRQVFSLDGESPDCYHPPQVAPEFGPLMQNIHNTCAGLQPTKSRKFKEAGINAIKESLDRFVKAGILQGEHKILIEEHLNRHPLLMMEL